MTSPCPSNVFDQSQYFRCVLSIDSEYSSQVSHFGTVRFVTAFAFGLGLGFHYLMHIYVYLLRRGNSSEFIHVERVYHLYGVAHLLSYGLLQGTSFDTTMSYFTLFSWFSLHISTFSKKATKFNKNGLWLIFYFFLWIWYWGIIINFYLTFRNIK